MKTLLICGGRDYDDWGHFTATCIDVFNKHGRITHIIAGGARGADKFARWLANGWGIPFTEYPADWKQYGKAAGFIRNKQMLDEGKPNLVLAFPGGKGTEMMMKIARAAGVEVIEA